jgi:O-antigen/teichoic acid export membrane protein
MVDEFVATDTGPTSQRLVRRTLKDSAIYLPATLAQSVGGIVVTMVVSKLSDPASFGNYTMSVNLVMALSMIAGQWMNESLVRLTPQYELQGRKRQLYASLLYGVAVATVVLGVLAWGGLLVLRQWIDVDLFDYLSVAAWTFPLMVAFASVRSWCRATGRSAAFSLLVTWRVVGGILLGLLIYYLWQTGAIGFLWGMVASWSVIVAGFLLKRRSRFLAILAPANVSRSVVIEALRYSLPMQGIAISALLLSISDRYLVGGFLSTYLAGIYALSYSIAQKGMDLVIQSFFRAMPPILYGAWARDGISETRKLVEQLSRYYAIAAVPMATGLTILSREIVVLFSSAEYADGAQIVGIVTAAMVLYGYAHLFEVPFALTKRTMPLLVVYLVSTVFNLAVNVLFIPRYGYVVAAWSTLASYALMMAMLAVWSRREVPMRVFGPWVWKPVFASGVMAAALIGLRQWIGTGIPALALEVAVGVLVYGIVIVAIRGVSSSELRTLSGLARRRLSGRK